ncbi:glycosyl transferase [Xenorhabdus mauleonii]|uniref:Glycosyl transferase n=1 Tax=Xenorhabdus mauleonii TaxID=351675 RepID=A0A1I3TVS1_9GAMM|nr:glycosyltransferase family 4 protein [Xenorhabdus mauleonii]PHM39585.1 glycosyl transferase [Xenorhabdus mauleonii]SFJ74732.1 Glycosyltransferase involved in cell wall bisynthesis [Xenorhabdus mauleonii]
MKINNKDKIKVGLIVDEFFGAANTRFGGYGYLARNYIAKYLPNKELEIDVLLGKGKNHFSAEKHTVDNISLYKLPRRKWFARQWLKKKNYDIYFSVELTYDHVIENEPNKDKRLILWIQDPRPMYEWDEIFTVKLFPETSYYNQKIYDLVHDWYKQGRVKFISQAYCLNDKAKDLYKLDSNVDIEYIPNPIDIDESFDVTTHKKKDMIIFLGRIASVKRGWLFCEIAKKMPEYDFYVLGKIYRDDDKNHEIMADYKKINNLHFTGHLEGERKNAFLRDAKILVNTSIHEALPVSFLEALSFGTLLVSNRNPDDLTSKFGIHVGDVLGDGFDKIDLFVSAIRELMEDDTKREELAKQAVDYIKNNHNNDDFISKVHQIIKDEIANSQPK